MPKPDAVAELAEKLVRTLQQQKDPGGTYPLTVARLAALADPLASPEQVAKALGKKPFAAQMLLASKKQLDSPIALAEDAELLAASPLLLDFALKQLCGPDKPLHPLDKVVGQVDKPLRAAFKAALEMNLREGTLPASAGSATVKNKPNLFSRAFPPPLTPPAELARKLLETLRARRTEGGSAYPVTLNEVKRLTDETVKPPLFKKALAEDLFQKQVVQPVASRTDVPLALVEDRELLAGSPALLEYLLAGTTTSKKPLTTLAHLERHLVAEMVQPFHEAVSRQIVHNRLPPTVGMLTREQTTELYLVAQTAPAWILGQKLLAVLASQRKQNAPDTLLTLERLTALAAANASPEILAKALADKAVKERLLVALPGDPTSPVILTEDRDAFAAGRILLPQVLTRSRTPDSQALALPDLKKKLERTLQYTFEITVEKQMQDGALPPGVGSLRIKKIPYFFLLEDARASPPACGVEAVISPPPTAPGIEGEAFDRLFGQVFARLDGQRGGANLVSLVGLRQEMPVDRVVFDRELQRSRREGRYTLSAAEGRHGLSDEDREAAIVEGGGLLLFVSKRQG
jgi:hypothetical protein